MRTFTAKTEGRNRLGLSELLQRYANSQRVADRLTIDQAAHVALDTFKRAVRQELELLALNANLDENATEQHIQRRQLCASELRCSIALTSKPLRRLRMLFSDTLRSAYQQTAIAPISVSQIASR